MLFTREGTAWWRKGYEGSQASQVWNFDLDSRQFKLLCDHPNECRYPLWHPSGESFYYVGGQSGSFNLWQRELASGKETQVTHFTDDSVIGPTISGDGGTLVFRHLFDLYRFRPGKDERPQRLKIHAAGDQPREDTLRRTLEAATEVAFSSDGLEVAFVAGGDVWVMDTTLREPRQVTNTPGEETSLVFAPDNQSLYYIGDDGAQTDIWRTERADGERYWWQNHQFKHTRLTNDAESESNLQLDPTGKQLAFAKARGDLWLMQPDGKEARRLFASWNEPEYAFSPDGRWLAYALYDDDFNRDVWLLPVDGSQPAFNLSRHPANDQHPIWSPDGKMIAYTGERSDGEVDMYYVQLLKAASEQTSRDRKLKEALEKLNKARQGKAEPKPKEAAGDKAKPANDKPNNEKPTDDKAKADDKEEPKKPEQPPQVVIDFDGIHERVRRISVPQATESDLFWKHDSAKLAFNASINGKEGTYTVNLPEPGNPELLSSSTGRQARWISTGNQVLWLSGGSPASLNAATGANTAYKFSAQQELNLPAKRQAAFLMCWRAMRDHYYDGRFNNRNWDAIRRKYEDLALQAGDTETLTRVISLMLGELNGSHLGFLPTGVTPTPTSKPWREVTAHLGLRFDSQHRGPGWKVRDVIPGGPADRERGKIAAGEIILAVDGETVDPDLDPAAVLTGAEARDVVLRVRNPQGEVREVTLRPIPFSSARALLYESWVKDNRRAVENASGGKLGYLHVSAMNMPSFYRFESELYAIGAGKDGLVIDVRENGGGFTTDHLLTALTQPRHAITVPRGGGRGYPQDRTVYATWHKPIVVLCNQNSFSNAEIFSHAIKTLNRGKLVGVPTAGAVISTGAMRILDLGVLRMPFRGWFVLDTGQDMELNGAEPHYILWPQPGQMPAGKDIQLNKAVGVLKKDVAAWKKQPQAPLIKASERDEQPAAKDQQ